MTVAPDIARVRNRTRPEAHAASSASAFLPFAVVAAFLLVAGLVAHDHVLPLVAGSRAHAAPLTEPQAASPDGSRETSPVSAGSSRRASPLLTGEAARRAIRQRQREEATQRLSSQVLPGETGPAL